MVALWLTGQTINLMTLGGLALAVGILVDEATVEIENIHAKMERHRLGRAGGAAGEPRHGRAAAAGDALRPRGLHPVVLHAGVGPGPVRAAVAGRRLRDGRSYLLSSTFVPVLSVWLLRKHRAATRATAIRRRTLFDRFRDAYAGVLGGIVRGRWLVVPAYLAAAVLVIFGVGRAARPGDLPAGRRRPVPAPPQGPGRHPDREDRADRQGRALAVIRDEVGADGVEISVGYVGLIPSSYPINAIYQWTGGPEEAILRVALKEEAGVDVEALKRTAPRPTRPRAMPDVQFSFEPADIVSDVMSFGSPTPVEVAVSGPNFDESRAYAEKVRAELAKVPTLRDLQYAQALDYPTVSVEIDRERAGLSGVTAEEIARSLVTATSSSRFVVPNYWPDPKSGIGYQVQVEIPYQHHGLGRRQVETIPIQRSGGPSLLLRDVAEVGPRRRCPANTTATT